MAVDIITDTIIDRPLVEVAAYAGNPTNAPAWCVAIPAGSFGVTAARR